MTTEIPEREREFWAFETDDGQNYSVETAQTGDVEGAMQLIQTRVSWLKNRDVQQWQSNDYVGRFAASAESYVENGELFVVKNARGAVVATFRLSETCDEVWRDARDDDEALYFGKFATNPEIRGIGAKIIGQIREITKSRGKNFLRADVISTNQKLRNYYAGQGFFEVGEADFPEGDSRQVLIEMPVNEWAVLSEVQNA